MTPHSKTAERIVKLASPDDPLRIILIEDSKGDAILIEKALGLAMPDSHRVERAGSLSGALKLLSEQEYDVALLDRSLPDVEGFSGLHNLQTMAPELPVIFLTGHNDEMTALEAIREGAQDYLFKDRMDPHVIKRAIQYAVLRKQFEHVLIVQANYDMLTGLANRLLFENRLELALAKIRRLPGSLVVLFLDLDGFKQVNDNHGHITGDRLLKEVAKRLKQVLRRYDTVARFGGDEFAILLEGIPDTQHGEVVAQKILNLFDDPFTIPGADLEVGVSIGIASCESGQEANRDMLMRQADEAMYLAKADKGSSYRLAPSLASHRAPATG